MKLSSGILGVFVAAMSLSSGLEGLRRFERSLTGQQLAAAPSPVLTVLGASAVLVLGSWLCVALLRHWWARFSLILAWNGAALLVPVLGHLFRHTRSERVKTNLLVFLTPHVIATDAQMAARSEAERAKMPPAARARIGGESHPTVERPQ